MDDARIAGNCSDCSGSLSRALVREIRHYEKTHLLEVTCGVCERTFLVVEEEQRASHRPRCFRTSSPKAISIFPTRLDRVSRQSGATRQNRPRLRSCQKWP